MPVQPAQVREQGVRQLRRREHEHEVEEELDACESCMRKMGWLPSRAHNHRVRAATVTIAVDLEDFLDSRA